MADVDVSSLETALRACEAGDERPARSWLGLQGGAEADLVSAAWRRALEAQLALAAPEGVSPVPVETLRAFVGAPLAARAGAVEACAIWTRHAALRGARAAVDELVVVQRALGADLPEPAHLALEAGALWGAVAALDPAPASQERAEGLRAAATRAGRAALAIEAVALRALLCLGAGDPTAANRFARQASRMAQSEELPQSEYLAHMVLARMRRHAGSPHLATRILAALARVVPPVWGRWLAWESVLAAAPAPGPADGGPHPVERLLAAARAGDRAGFDEAGRLLVAAVEGWPPFLAEARALLGALDPDGPAPAEGTGGPLGDWRRGGVPSPPFGLHALALGASPGERSIAAYVVVGPGRPPRRVLAPGLALVVDGPGAAAFAAHQRRQARVDVALAALALSGAEGLDEETFFRDVYGFAYVKRIHHGALDTLLHRMREHLAAPEALERTPDRLRLQPPRLWAIPDPRCAPPLDHHVLQAVAGRGRATTRELAASLDLPVSSVQKALRRLSEEGLLHRRGAGNQHEYVLEDTTFSEPTRWR
jgi:hypothetical protein